MALGFGVGGVRLLPDPARRGAADAGRGRRWRRCSPGEALGQPIDVITVELPASDPAERVRDGSLGRLADHQLGGQHDRLRHVSSPSTRPSICRAMVRPISTIGWRTVVSGGSVYRADLDVVEADHRDVVGHPPARPRAAPAARRAPSGRRRRRPRPAAGRRRAAGAWRRRRTRG